MQAEGAIVFGSLVVLLIAVTAGGAVAGRAWIHAGRTGSSKRRRTIVLVALAAIGLLAFAAKDVLSDPPRWASAGLSAGLALSVIAGTWMQRKRE